MKVIIVWSLFLVTGNAVFCQSAYELITNIRQAQQQLTTVAYTLQRTDTFSSGNFRTISGSARLKVVPSDSSFGFHYFSKRDEPYYECIYDGRSVYSVNHAKKEYAAYYQPSAFKYSIGLPAGQLIVPELVRLDTSGATGFSVTQDEMYYYLTKYLPDNKASEQVNCYTVYTIDKKNMLPAGVLEHFEKLGKINGYDFRIKEIWVNEPSYAYDFTSERFPGDYKAPEPRENKVHKAMLGNTAPHFNLLTFDGKKISSEKLKGKVVLLDFWEVWCNPCITSMPKVQALYQKYKNQGLLVYGITNEQENIAPAKTLIKNKQIAYPQLVGNKQLENDYGVSAIPLYIIIDKTGKVSFIHEGFPENLEEEIKKLL